MNQLPFVRQAYKTRTPANRSKRIERVWTIWCESEIYHIRIRCSECWDLYTHAKAHPHNPHTQVHQLCQTFFHRPICKVCLNSILWIQTVSTILHFHVKFAQQISHVRCDIRFIYEISDAMSGFGFGFWNVCFFATLNLHMCRYLLLFLSNHTCCYFICLFIVWVNIHTYIFLISPPLHTVCNVFYLLFSIFPFSFGSTKSEWRDFKMKIQSNTDFYI